MFDKATRSKAIISVDFAFAFFQPTRNKTKTYRVLLGQLLGADFMQLLLVPIDLLLFASVVIGQANWFGHNSNSIKPVNETLRVKSTCKLKMSAKVCNMTRRRHLAGEIRVPDDFKMPGSWIRHFGFLPFLKPPKTVQIGQKVTKKQKRNTEMVQKCN